MNPPVQSLSRGLAIVDHLAQANSPQPLATLCKQFDLKPATAHNLLKTLVAHGYAHKHAGHTGYSLGYAISRIAERFQSQQTLERVAAALVDLKKQWPQLGFSYAEEHNGDILQTMSAGAPPTFGIFHSQRRLESIYASSKSLLIQASWSAEKRALYQERYPFSEFGGTVLWPDEAALNDYLSQPSTCDEVAIEVPALEARRMSVPVFESGRIRGALACGIRISDETNKIENQTILSAMRVATQTHGIAGQAPIVSTAQGGE